jgi:3-O-methylgallate 3,4-dioxygenase
MPYQDGVNYVSPGVQARFKGTEPFAEQAAQFLRSLDTLASTLRAAQPDVTVIISDDQDEWLYEHDMPRFAVYWGDSVPMRPRLPAPTTHPAVRKAIERGYGDIPLEVPVASELGRPPDRASLRT